MKRGLEQTNELLSYYYSVYCSCDGLPSATAEPKKKEAVTVKKKCAERFQSLGANVDNVAKEVEDLRGGEKARLVGESERVK